jgi:hypothetical protein
MKEEVKKPDNLQIRLNLGKGCVRNRAVHSIHELEEC